MGRNARRRAEERNDERPHGLGPEDEKRGETRDRCPSCGSNRLVTVQRPLGVPPDAPPGTVMCLNCSWQGNAGLGY